MTSRIEGQFFKSEFKSFLQDNLDNDTNTKVGVIWNYDFVFFLNPKIESYEFYAGTDYVSILLTRYEKAWFWIAANHFLSGRSFWN